MTKTNVLVYAAILVCSIVLLVIWNIFGLDAYSQTSYTLISSLWWVVIVVCVGVLAYTEFTRRRAIRTIYVSRTRLYNLEFGLVRVQDDNYVGSLSGIMSKLRYGFARKSVPNLREMGFRYVVHTHKYADNGAVWTGDVKDVFTKRTRTFDSPDQLAKLLTF